MESFFSSLKTEPTARKLYRTRDQARADVFDYIECFYNPKRRHSTIGYMKSNGANGRRDSLDGCQRTRVQPKAQSVSSAIISPSSSGPFPLKPRLAKNASATLLSGI